MSSAMDHAASVVQQNFEVLSANFARLYRDRKPLLIGLILSFIGTIATARAAWNDYKLFISYGPGGVPYNPLGWMISNSLRLLGVDRYGTQKVDAAPDKRIWLGEDWPEKKRSGPRPRVGPHPIPSRQLDQHTTDAMKQKFLEEFTSLAKQNAHLVEVKQSQLENHTEAMFVLPDNPGFPLEGTRRELAHVHGTGEYSAHVILSPQDCKKVIESGWGELHMLSGVEILRRIVGVKLPDSYTLIYSPRDDEELQTELEIVKAAIGYMTDSRDVK